MPYGNLSRDFLTAGWAGRLQLRELFWPYERADQNLFSILILITLVATSAYPPLGLLFLAWYVVSLWQCAFNAKWVGWGYTVRVALLVLAIVVVFPV